METDFKEVLLQLYKKIWGWWKYLKKEPFKNNFFNAKPKQKAVFCHLSQSEWAQMQELKSLLKT